MLRSLVKRRDKQQQAILPVLLVYIFLSRYIVKGVTAGSVSPHSSATPVLGR